MGHVLQGAMSAMTYSMSAQCGGYRLNVALFGPAITDSHNYIKTNELTEQNCHYAAHSLPV